MYRGNIAKVTETQQCEVMCGLSAADRLLCAAGCHHGEGARGVAGGQCGGAQCCSGADGGGGICLL